jgi:CRISPR-associated endonuclease Cas1
MPGDDLGLRVPAPSTRPGRAGRSVITVTGHGVRLKVWLHSLWVEDGFKSDGNVRRRTLTRATSNIERLLFLAGSGFVTVDALDWCAENGVPVVAVSQSGAPRWTLLPGAGGVHQAALRRAQALAPFTNAGLEMARWLIARKVAGQRDVLRTLAGRLTPSRDAEWSRLAVPGAAAALDRLLPRLHRPASIAEVRQVEAEAAAVYWSGWAGLPLHFAPPSYKKKVPGHWQAFRGRGSPLTDGPRSAVDPVNALLNYAYALLEAEARMACHEAGVDPSLGILHTDTERRRSLIYDLMEPVRPVADRLVLSLLLSHAFRPGELWALRDGRCRLDQDLCARLWPWMPTFRQALGPIITFLLGRLRRGPRYGDRTAYRLVEVTPSVKTRAPLGQKRWAREAPAPAIQSVNACRSCGVLLEGERPDRRFCESCEAPLRAARCAEAAAVGRATLARLRLDGHDPAHGGSAARRRGATQRRQHRARATAAGGPMLDSAQARAQFHRFLPRLRQVPLRRIASALGVTPGYASFLRRGLRTPHPRHLAALRALADARA